MQAQKYNNSTPFIDMLFNLSFTFILLFIMAFLLIQENERKKINDSNEFRIIMTWHKDSLDDVDLYVGTPDGDVCFFQNREAGFTALLFDDLGKKNDIIQTPDGPIELIKNEEVVMLRRVLVGEYIVNCHMYDKALIDDGTEVTAILEDVQSGQILAQGKVKLQKRGDEQTLFRFSIDADRKVYNINKLPKVLSR